MRIYTAILSFLTLCALAACDNSGSVSPPEAVTPDESEELKQAEEMLDVQRPQAAKDSDPAETPADAASAQ
ncbi:hypothetical protein [Sphingorhabdus sp. Alg239-R122]|uniref:hypothetical protein n=1 Tax=Sphingorhabdus sp. Alg239-R122 TaxID=2305989 RepID=UPI0013DA19B8|nr:hypothetical protein [Sphingorhabdus sp. Alg239-R122]